MVPDAGEVDGVSAAVLNPHQVPRCWSDSEGWAADSEGGTNSKCLSSLVKL